MQELRICIYNAGGPYRLGSVGIQRRCTAGAREAAPRAPLLKDPAAGYTPMVCPPSTTSAWPVTKEDSSETRNSTA